MMATVPLSSSSLLPLLESLEDDAAGASEQTDAYLTIANRLSGEDGRQFFPIIVKHFSRLGKSLQTHISSENEELSQAALQALGFCVFNTNIVSGIPAHFAEEILLALCALVLKSTDKNTCTRALWVISKQNFPAEVVSKKTPEILKTLDAMQTRDIQSILMEHESLNVVIKLLDQAPTQMGQGAVFWAKLVIPLVVHSASKVRLRAAAALEMGLPLLLEKQQEVAAIVEPMMSTKLIPEMQKLFSTKNESNVLKLWPLFVKLLGKLLHKGGAFINSLLYLEELGFRSSSPNIKKIAFLAWKSLIDNFALNPEILCSSKRLKLLMQPLSSILVRTEALLLTKLEVWWYLVVKLGPNLATNFEQVALPLLQNTLSPDGSLQGPATPARNSSQSNGVGLSTPKSSVPSCSTPGANPRLSLNSSTMSLNSSTNVQQSYTSIQLLGLEMLLHYFLGSQATSAAAKNKLQLNLEPLTHNLLSSQSFFSKHSSTFISSVKNAFMAVGKDAPEPLLSLIWNSLVNLVSTTIETAGNKKERQGSEVLTHLLQALQSILSSEALPAPRALALLEATVKGIPQKVLGSAAYQVANMDVLNGTPALFLILLFYNSNMLSSFLADEKFFLCLETLVSCGLSGPTSPLAFVEAVLGTISRNVEAVENKEHLWRMWSVVVNPLTDTITQTNEVNQGDALEHNFSAIHSALMFPITHLLPGSALPQMTQKSMLSTWSRLYKAFARCSALVATAEENVCCEELCTKISATLDGQALKTLSTLDAVANILHSIVDSVDFSPFTPQFQQKMKSPHTPLGWVRKRNNALGNLSKFHVLLVQSLDALQHLNSSNDGGAVLSSIGSMLISVVSTLFTSLALPTVIHESLSSLTKALALLYEQVESSDDEQSKSHSVLGSKLEKLAGEMLGCLQTRSALLYDDDLLAVLSPLLCVLFPHKNKQIRLSVTQFWNATFGNALTLTYPEMLTPVLSQAKQKAPLILPGFEAVGNSEDFSGEISSECSQLDTKISGIKVTPAAKRESLLAKAGEIKERSSTTSKPVSVKLDFGSPKPPRREVLEEEASVDFVFIPPESKKRVLTEHQKEVKRTKRDDIPAMYNNLDASLDTTVFTQYTQSQEESLDKLPADESQDKVNKVETKGSDTEESSVSDSKEAENNVCPENDSPEKVTNNADGDTEMQSPPGDLPVSDAGEHEDTTAKDHSPNVSGSSDMISGTPPKSSSRRQSFITLEKYVEPRPASPMSVTKFTGPLTRTSHSQETPKSEHLSPKASSHSQLEAGTGAGDSAPQTEKENVEMETEMTSVANHSNEGTGDEEDVIPDTQTQVLNGAVDDEADNSLDKSQVEMEIEASPEGPSEGHSPVSNSSQAEPRRSGRRRSKPVRPGEEELKSKQQKKDFVDSSALPVTEKPAPTKQDENVLPGRSRRGKVLEENKGELENHSQNDSQIAMATTVSSPQVRSRSKSKEHSQTEHSTDKQSPLSQSESQSQGRPSRRTRLSVISSEVSDKSQSGEGSQTDSQTGVSVSKNKLDTPVPNIADGQSPGRPKRTRRAEAADAQSKEKHANENEPVSDLSQSGSQTLAPARGRPGRRKKAEEDAASSKDAAQSQSVNSESSQTEETKDSQDSSQGRNKYNTRRSSQGLLQPVENSESGTSETKEGQRTKKARGHRSLASEVVPDTTAHNKVSEKMLDKENADPVEMTEKPVEPEACLGVSILSKTSSDEKEEKVSVTEDPESSGPVSDVSSEKQEENVQCDSQTDPSVLKSKPVVSDEASQSPNAESAKSEQKHEESKMEVDSEKVEESAAMEEKAMEGQTLASSQNNLVLPEKVVLKTPDLHRCPHTKRGRGRRRSANCNCFLARSAALSQENVTSDSQASQDLNNELSQQSNTLQSELSDAKPDLIEKEGDVAVVDNCPVVAGDQSSPALTNTTDGGLPTETPVEEPDVINIQESGVKEDTNQVVEEDQNGNADEGAGDAEKKIQEKENDSCPTGNTISHEQSLRLSPQGASENHGEPVEDGALCQDQSELPVQQIAVDCDSEEKPELPMKDDEQEIGEDGITPHLEEDAEDTQIDQEDQEVEPKADLSEVPLPPQTASTAETCLDSPPKHKYSEALCGEVAQSPSGSVTRGVWSPTASPSTSILKKGQKRQFEDDTPSPLLKSRRVSFANPIYQQELADDIDRRSPVIRTSSPRSKSIGQPKYITTPTKGLLTLSPRNLRSPGYKSSKKCLISEMSQEPRPIPKDCVYPALVCCSTPVEAVLPQISSNMWPRGLGQLVRARNIKTVGDLSALTPSEIKLLPVRSPKLSNVKKALKTYHEQQRKGRPDDLKSFDEMEKMTSEPEEVDAAPNQEEEHVSTKAQDVLTSEMTPVSEQKEEAPVSVELLSDVAALGARLTPEELSRCTPRELGAMHEQLSGMMRNIVDHLQSRLVSKLEDSLL
uniref:Replication timing regulatory factor 1 n=1 Tax=Astyanax mexicanus TaxID=7994 RepID=W5KUD7_ASTMX